MKTRDKGRHVECIKTAPVKPEEKDEEVNKVKKTKWSSSSHHPGYDFHFKERTLQAANCIYGKERHAKRGFILKGECGIAERREGRNDKRNEIDRKRR